MTQEKPKFLEDIDKILREQAYIEARGRDDFAAPKIPVSRQTQEMFMKFLNESLTNDDEEIRQAASFVKTRIESGECELYQAPEIIYHDDGSRMYVQLGVGIYLWDEDGGKRIPKEQLIEVIMAEYKMFND